MSPIQPNIILQKTHMWLVSMVEWHGPGFISLNNESLIDDELARNRGHYFSLDNDDALQESLAREDEDCIFINDMRDTL